MAGAAKKVAGKPKSKAAKSAKPAKVAVKKIGGGRIAAHEIMVGTSAIRNLIREAKVAQMYSAIQTGRRDGMQTLDQSLKELVDKGLVNSQIAATKAVDKALFY